MRTFYEWTIETVEESEIVDSDRSERLSSFAAGDLVSAAARKGSQLALVCGIYDDDFGLVDRFWAYTNDRKLPQKFGDSERLVPARFHKELATEMKRTTAPYSRESYDIDPR